jgi:hypothetical protein
MDAFLVKNVPRPETDTEYETEEDEAALPSQEHTPRADTAPLISTPHACSPSRGHAKNTLPCMSLRGNIETHLSQSESEM